MGNSCCCAEHQTAVKSNIAFFDELPPGVSQTTVDHVCDGDTLTIHGENCARVRLLGIDAPQRRGNDPYARRATEYLKKMCPANATVWLQVQSGGNDPDGQTLALLFVSNPSGGGGFMCVNIALLERGLATFHNPAESRILFGDQMLNAQQIAITSKLNIWKKQNIQGEVVCTPNGISFHTPDCITIEQAQLSNLQRLPMAQALAKGLSPCRQCDSMR
ncbi:hypothetical protein JKF63_07177 [Porcisia hertigi]|uniref:TNase-like domain-containing protein n=1 Tax=Porcisia hertigi TaxID=2761500 RepID=A0A836LKG8_9TRYP|nr:hypothetical protein JKF63_07177 [Porcisia hertigi]